MQAFESGKGSYGNWVWWEWKPYCEETDESLAWEYQRAAYGACKTGYGGGVINTDGSVQLDRVPYVVRMYPQSVQGSSIWSQYESETKTLKFRMYADPSISEPTQVFTGTEKDISADLLGIDPSLGYEPESA